LYDCIEGYGRRGDPEVTCEVTGAWSAFPVCLTGESERQSNFPGHITVVNLQRQYYLLHIHLKGIRCHRYPKVCLMWMPFFVSAFKTHM